MDVSSKLLDFSQLENEMVSGISTETYNQIVDDQWLSCLQSASDENQIFKILEEDNHEFDDINEELDNFERNWRPQSSVLQEKNHVQKFKAFLKENGKSDAIETMPVAELNNNLRHFYSQLSRLDGQPYSGSSLLCIRAAIHRFLTTAPVNRSINIISDRNFLTSNNMLKAKIAEWLKTGNNTKHFGSIEIGDQHKLMDYFDQSTPKKLQQEIWYNIIYYLGNRGREGMKDLRLSSVCFTFDSDGKEYAYLQKPHTQKNVKPSLSPKDFDDRKQARMYAVDNHKNCPVKTMRLYLSKIPTSCKTLFPKPKKDTSNEWYYPKQCVGKTLLGTMMVQISNDAGLSKKYTNHCIRSTAVTNLRDDGFERNEVCAITGHKSEKSIERYDRNLRKRSLRKLSTSLGNKRQKVEEKKFEGEGRASKYHFEGNVHFINCSFS